jgi:acyl-CoA synthetase (NDP forming)
VETIEDLDLAFSPGSVAVVGAFGYEGGGGGILLRCILEGGYTGRVYPINRNRPEIMGLKAFPSVLDVPDQVDVAVIAVSAANTAEVLIQCQQKGVRFAVIHSAGFGELGDHGKELEMELVRIAESGGPRIIGPNCMGVYCPHSGFNTVVTDEAMVHEAGPVAVIGQSGWATENIVLLGYDRGLRFSKVVSIGNQSDINVEDYLEYLAADSDTMIIACYLEGLKRGRDFIDLAARVTKRKPIVVWKGGRTLAGVAAVRSHTGSLAGNDAVFNAVMQKSGVIPAQGLEELVDIVTGMASVLPSGKRLGLLSGGGAVSVTCADACEMMDLAMPSLPEEAQNELRKVLQPVSPWLSSVVNPVDTGWMLQCDEISIYCECLNIIMRHVDVGMLMTFAPLNQDLGLALADLRDRFDKPIMVLPGHPIKQRQGMSLLTKIGVPAFPVPDRAMRAIAAMVRYASYLRHSSK